jgi:hypothetical protein
VKNNQLKNFLTIYKYIIMFASLTNLGFDITKEEAEVITKPIEPKKSLTGSSSDTNEDDTNEDDTNEDDTNEDDTNEDDTNEDDTVPDTEIFTISVNDNLLYYMKDFESAVKSMWGVGRRIKVKHNSFDEELVLCESYVNEVQLLGRRRFLLVSYDRVICTLRVDKISQLDAKDE